MALRGRSPAFSRKKRIGKMAIGRDYSDCLERKGRKARKKPVRWQTLAHRPITSREK
jgi:hypothetical protein